MFAKSFRDRVSRKVRDNRLITPAILFMVALAPRALSLGAFVTCDEPMWLNRSSNFFIALSRLNFADTYQSMHPGVTVMWLAGLQLDVFTKLASAGLLKGWGFNDYLFLGSFPVALATSTGVVIMYFLLRRLFNARIAIIAGLLVAFDPFLISYSRIIHLDGLLATFMALSVLSLLVFLKYQDKKYLLVLAGAFTGLAMLTKLPGVFLIPFSALVVAAWQLPGMRSAADVRAGAVKAARAILVFTLAAALVFIALWPAMWVTPVQTVERLTQSLGEVTLDSNGQGFFMGESPAADYTLFYPVTILMKTTPVTLFFSLACLAVLAVSLSRLKLTSAEKSLLVIVAFIALFVLQMAMGSKKYDRYVLPAFPAIDMLAAVGLWCVADRAGKLLDKEGYKGLVLPALAVLAVAVQLALVLQVQPYYLSYYDPMLGGPSQAPKIFTVGWGEGMDLAAQYLNEKPDAANLTVAEQYPGFGQYFVGKTVWWDQFGSSGDPDYLVFYLSALQRNWSRDIWDKYRGSAPEKVISINGIGYFWIYRAMGGT